ncbi:MAG: TlpA family protein disulfide reductase [Phycisphaerales bacterium]|nr:TlpA family protein disulfide reductase [Phycisphaerales bacterium]
MVSLASLKGKTVILDFWATWCGPCKQGLPILMEIAKSRAADNVVLWSVDMGEPATKVQQFLERSKWDLNVMLDQKNQVAKKYGVRGIPHTVVIGPDGIVQLVEIGFGGKEHTTKAMNTIIDEIKSGASGS